MRSSFGNCCFLYYINHKYKIYWYSARNSGKHTLPQTIYKVLGIKTLLITDRWTRKKETLCAQCVLISFLPCSLPFPLLSLFFTVLWSVETRSLVRSCEAANLFLWFSCALGIVVAVVAVRSLCVCFFICLFVCFEFLQCTTTTAKKQQHVHLCIS